MSLQGARLNSVRTVFSASYWHFWYVSGRIEESTSNRNAEDNLKTQMNNSANSALDDTEVRAAETRYTNY